MDPAVKLGVGLVILRTGSREVVMSVQPQLSLISVSVEEPWMIHLTTRVLVARVVPQCGVELEGVSVRTANVYTENLSCFTEVAGDGHDLLCVDQIVNTEVSDGRARTISAGDQIPSPVIDKARV